MSAAVPPAKRARTSPDPPSHPPVTQAQISQLSLQAAHQLIFLLQNETNASLISTWVAEPTHRAPPRAKPAPIDFSREIARADRALDDSNSYGKLYDEPGDALGEVGEAIDEILSACRKNNTEATREAAASAICSIAGSIVGCEGYLNYMLELGVEDTLVSSMEDLAEIARGDGPRADIISAVADLSSTFSEYGGNCHLGQARTTKSKFATRTPGTFYHIPPFATRFATRPF